MSLSISNLPNRKYIPLLLKELSLNGIGIELGVAEAHYSEVILQNSNLKTLYGVDSWSHRRHTSKEYRKVKRRTKQWGSRFIIVRKRFDEVDW